jgi:hypothetical protein
MRTENASLSTSRTGETGDRNAAGTMKAPGSELMTTDSGAFYEGGTNSADPQNTMPDPISPSGVPPPWLVLAADRFRRTLRILNIVRQIKVASTGCAVIAGTFLVFLLRHSPSGQSFLLAVSLWGLPICLAISLAARVGKKRLLRTRNDIARLMYSAGMRFDDQGRVLTDDPHPSLILDASTGSGAQSLPPSVATGS